MNNLFAQLIIIALIGGIIFTVKFLCSTIGEGDSGYNKLKKGNICRATRKQRVGTYIMPTWEIQLLNDRGEIVKKKPISFLPGKGFYIGSSEECDFVIKSPFISSKHAIIAEDENGYFIKDLNSKNKIRVENEVVEEIDLRDGMLLCLANIPCRIVKEDPFMIFEKMKEEKSKERIYDFTDTEPITRLR